MKILHVAAVNRVTCWVPREKIRVRVVVALRKNIWYPADTAPVGCSGVADGDGGWDSLRRPLVARDGDDGWRERPYAVRSSARRDSRLSLAMGRANGRRMARPAWPRRVLAKLCDASGHRRLAREDGQGRPARSRRRPRRPPPVAAARGGHAAPEGGDQGAEQDAVAVAGGGASRWAAGLAQAPPGM